MGRMFEEQAVIDCLTNTAKYYEREDADEWTKGIHYGLLHGLDNILDNVPTVEAIPKANYEARLKAEKIAMLKNVQSEIAKMAHYESADGQDLVMLADVGELFQQKINALKGEQR